MRFSNCSINKTIICWRCYKLEPPLRVKKIKIFISHQPFSKCSGRRIIERFEEYLYLGNDNLNGLFNFAPEK